MTSQKTPNSQSSHEKEQSQRHHTSRYQTTLQSSSDTGIKNRHIHERNGIETRMQPSHKQRTNI